MLFVLPQVLLGDTPCRVPISKQLLHPLLLLILINIKEEFQDRVAVIRKCPFKPLDTADLLSKRFLVQLLMHTVSHDFFHPAAIHERELSILRNPLEIPV